MAGRDELRQALIDAKLSGTKTAFGYEFNSNETAAAKALDVLTTTFGISPARPLPDHDNHHNAAVCPYCTGNGDYVVVKADDVRHLMLGTREQQDEAMGKLLVALGMED